MSYIAVFVRQLPGSRPVVSKVIGLPDEPEEVRNARAASELSKHKHGFIQKFNEFGQAEWYFDIVKVEEYGQS